MILEPHGGSHRILSVLADGDSTKDELAEAYGDTPRKRRKLGYALSALRSAGLVGKTQDRFWVSRSGLCVLSRLRAGEIVHVSEDWRAAA